MIQPQFGLRAAEGVSWGGWPRPIARSCRQHLRYDGDVLSETRTNSGTGVRVDWLVGERWLVAGTPAVVGTRQDDDHFLDYQPAPIERSCLSCSAAGYKLVTRKARGLDRIAAVQAPRQIGCSA